MDATLERGIRLFNDGRYFECHEILEEAWRPERGRRRLFLQGLIHVAVGCYHHTRGNPVGAARQLRKALRKLAGYGPVWEGIDLAGLCRDTREALQEIEAGGTAARYPKIRVAGGTAAGR